MRPTPWLVSALVLCACADQTAITVEVSSPDLAVPGDLDQLRIQVTAPSGVMADTTSDLPGTWPQTLAIRPGASQVGEAITIRVFGLQGGTQRIRRVLSNVRFTRGQNMVIDVILTRACLDVACSGDADCNGGMCVGGMVDAGTDAGMDAGVDADIPEDTDVPDDVPSDVPADTPEVLDTGTDAPVDMGTDSGPMDAGPDPVLLFTEVVEGSGNNKALEITNIGGGSVDLSTCTLTRITNGGASSPSDVPLTGTLVGGASHVICNPSGGPALLPLCDETSGRVAHNGDDGYLLECPGLTSDSFGANTGDPGEAWTGGGVTTFDRTLRRKCSISAPDPNMADAFDPSVEWDQFATDTFTGLGEHCP